MSVSGRPRGRLALVSVALWALGGCGVGSGAWRADGGVDLSMGAQSGDGGGGVLFAGILFSGCPQVVYGPAVGGRDAGSDGMDGSAGDMAASTDMGSAMGEDMAAGFDLGDAGRRPDQVDGGSPDANLDTAPGRELPRCIGTVPLQVTLVPLSPPGATAWQWTMPDGAPASSQASSPSVSYTRPGIYTVGLVIGSAAGEASAQAEIEVRPASVGAPCVVDEQCAPGLSCLCAGPTADAGPSADGGATCPPELRLCTRGCSGTLCDDAQTCVDLSRSTRESPSTAGDPWRRPLCLPTCATDADCAPGTTCRELPALVDGARAGGPFTWRRACFPALLGDVGSACIDADGRPAPADCLGGTCLALGARNLCTSPCDEAPCPDGAACATFAGDPTRPVCLPRCGAQHPCGDPLLDCQPARPDDADGFRVPATEPSTATYCAPRRCAGDADCAPAGTCRGLSRSDGGVGDGGVGLCGR